MEYVEKTCPACGRKFIVEERVAHRELYCTLGCQARAEEEKVSA